jgi:DNA recombination protein RmuC
MFAPLEFTSLLLGSLLGILAGSLIMLLILGRRLQRTGQQLSEQAATLKQQESELTRRETELREARARELEQQQATLEMHRDLARQQEAYSQLTDRIKEREAEVAQLQAHFQKEFENLAQRILDRSAEKLATSHEDKLKHLLDPLGQRLQAFEKQVQETYQQEARERFSLQKEVQRLFELNQQMSADTQNLTRALKGESKTQGNWGELVLSRVLESSGLREGEEFISQAKDIELRDADGRRLQPDVLVRLPDQKHLIVDAKVSLTAYERYVAAETEAAQAAALSQHLDSLTRHIQQLSDKHYAALQGLDTPDFVLMFLPIEPAFHLALQARNDLFVFAWERKIVLVSPTTLLATLKTVASLWKLEQQNAHAEEIARQGGALYDKFVGFVEELKKVGKQLDRSQQTYQEAMQKLSTGHGNLMTRAERLRELGVKHNKRLE